jgi:hypothetical protein
VQFAESRVDRVDAALGVYDLSVLGMHLTDADAGSQAKRRTGSECVVFQSAERWKLKGLIERFRAAVARRAVVA